MVSQLRIYTINKGKLDDFVSGWKQFVHPLHYKFGFTIDRADVIRERIVDFHRLHAPGFATAPRLVYMLLAMNVFSIFQ